MNAIVADNISKCFETVQAVRDLSVTVPVGCVYGFLGPNGAGKTTTIRMIMNIIYPDRGRVRILDYDSPAKARERIGYMPEERGLYRKMTVRKVLTYLGSIKGMSHRRLREAIPNWLNRVGLADWADRKVEELSRGMGQKLQFVATVINDPQILILDEPFSGLDPVNLDLLKEIILDMQQAGKTVVFSTHIMEQAEKLCDFILLINQGTVVVDGPLDQIRSRYQTNAVVVELDGDDAFIDGLPTVECVVRRDNRIEITLADGADEQHLLAALIERARVRRFEVKVPTLHEIFVHFVGTAHASHRQSRPARIP